ncbi:MAG: amidase, partial [Dehalococcoidia bacterium]|nr:amidase [Dehalococcoidia bacterium]
ARIERLNPAINAVITPLPEEARRIAAELPDDDRPFRGVPILLKDGGEELEGTRYTLGTPVLRDLDYRSIHTTELVRRLLDAGFIPVGKTNLPELSSGFTTEPVAFGPTRNPWDLERTVGGSSGGSAAAVAAGLVSIAQGSDATGSIRVPAAACGVATLRPTPGRVPTAIPADQPIERVWSAFVLARSLRDLVGTFEVVANDGVPPPDVPALRIGLLTHDPGTDNEIHPAVTAAVQRAAAALEACGHDVTFDFPPTLDGFMRRIAPWFAATAAPAREAQLRWLERTVGHPLQPGDVGNDYERIAGEPSPERQQEAQALLIRETTTLLEWWNNYDVLVAPTIGQPAWPLGLPDGAQNTGLFVFPYSFTRQPVLALPLGASDEGLPVSVQLIGRPGEDELLLALGTQLEAAAPWTDRWPPFASQ